MGYERKPRGRFKWEIAIPLGLLVLALGYLILNLVLPKKTNENIKTICSYSDTKSINLLTKEYKDTFEIKDYLFYGESLSFFKEKYEPQKTDELQSKTIRLINLCTSEEILFQLSNTLDRQITLPELDDGVYEVYVINNLENYRMTATEEFKDRFHTVTRNNGTKKIEVVATKNYANATEETSVPYVFLNVSSEAKQNNSIDVLIDPYGGANDYGMGIDYGFEGNGLVENNETFVAAELLKKELESYGLKVGITKKDVNQKIDTNGKNGRIVQGYEQNAKYYISLQFNKHALSDVNGIEITHSNTTSATLANTIVNGMEKLGLKGNILYPGTLANGVRTPQLMDGDDGRKIYDSNFYLRETGGYATAAGMMNKKMKELNGDFAFENRKGMQAIVVHLLYISNPKDYKLWIDHKEELMTSMADSIALSLNVEKREN